VGVKLLLVAGLFAASGPVHGQSTACPAEQSLARANALAFATSQDYARARSRHSLPVAMPADIRLLQGTADAAACAQLHAWVDANSHSPADRWHRTFYRVGNHFYIALTQVSDAPATVPPGYTWVSLAHHPLYILDLNFERVAGIAM
jgi:nitrate reductase cytochrome c-type subunit